MSNIIQTDNLLVLTTTPDNSIDLIYIDPPFGTGKIQDTSPIGYNEHLEGQFYSDVLVGDEYLQQINIRLHMMHRVLKDTGSIYVHLDFRMAYKVRILLDRIFGAANFMNEIIWAYDYGGRPKDRWPRKHDTILWYAKHAGKHTFNYNDIERIPYMAPGLVGPEKAARGKLPTDVWWMTIVPTNSKERTGYPNQKPVKLIERIIEASSKPGQLVADFYCGSGTTGVAAQNLGREFLLVDNSPLAIQVTKDRLKWLN